VRDTVDNGPDSGSRADAHAPTPPFVLLVALTSASPFALNAITPAMPRMADDLGVSFGIIQLVLTAALVGFGASQLVAGPLSDRYGRRPVVLGGLLLFAVGSLVSALSTAAVPLILGRVLQASGGAAAFVLTRTIIYDTKPRDEATAAISYMVMAMVLAPMAATYLGGMMVDAAGWRPIFWLITALGWALLVVTSVTLRETNRLVGTARSFAQILREARELLQVRDFWAFTASAAFASGMFFAFLGVAPYVVEKIMQRSPSEFGVYFVLISCGYMAGNFTSGQLARRLGPLRMLQLGFAIAAVGIVLFWAMSGIDDPIALFLPMMFLTLSNGITLPSATVGAMAIRPELSGTASGVTGALQMVLASVLTTIVGALVTTTDTAMLAALTACWLASGASLLLLRR
jgi:DHA1 family bicyclomycin/chloramphenicol resistance-like MFS transporter